MILNLLIRKKLLMEKRIGSILIVIKEKHDIDKMNHILSSYANIILGRQGLSLKDHSINVISLVLEGRTDDINALTGKLGRLNGITVKSVLSKED